MNSNEIDNDEALAAGAAASTKLMERMTAISLKRASGKPGKSVRLE